MTAVDQPPCIGVLGAGGRMGRMLIQAIQQAGTTLGAAVEQPNSEFIGQDAGSLAGLGNSDVSIAANFAEVIDQADVWIDFTAPNATLKHAELCQQHSKPLVVGTTGMTAEQQAHLRDMAKEFPLVYAANYSVGVNLSLKLLAMAAQALAPDWDIEVIEAHHRHKVDAPSGTALMMGEAMTEALGWNLAEDAIYCREGQTGARPRGKIGFQTIRGGDIVGEHTVMFIGEGERLEITHKATSRMNFASGAVRAACWVIGRPAGCYDMQSVLGLDK